MAVKTRPLPVADQVNRLAWEQDAVRAGLTPTAAFLRWLWSERYQGSPAWRVILAPPRVGETG